MKAHILLIFFVLSAGLTLNAQIKEQTIKMSEGNNNALSLEIPNVSDKLVNEVWKDYLKDFYDSKPKWNRKTDEWFADDADIAALGLGNTVDIYATVEERKENVVLNMWVNLGGAYLNSKDHRERYTEAEKMLMRFGLEVARVKTEDELEDEQDQLKELQKELSRLKSYNERYHKEIERAKEAIKKAEQDIVDNEKEQEQMLKTIEEQEAAIKAVEKRLNDL